MRHHPLSRSLAAFIAAVILLNIPGPDALAQSAAVVRSIPSGRMDAPLGSLGSMSAPAVAGQGSGIQLRFEASSLLSLPGLGAPGVSLQEASPAVPGTAEVPVLSPSPKDSAPAPVVETKGRSFLGLFRRSPSKGPDLKELKKRVAQAEKERKAAEGEREARAKEQKLIDRVLEVSIELEKAEDGGSVSDEDLRKTADQVWGLDSGPAVLPAVEASGTAGGGKTQVLPRGTEDEVKARGPPAPSTEAVSSRKESVIGSLLSKTLQGLFAASSGARKALAALLAPISRLWASLPSGGRVSLAAALTAGADFAARLLLPAVFGFVPGAGLWVTLGLGGVVIPALALTRRSLVKQNAPSLAPLVRYADLLLGVLLGAAAVTGIGVLGLDLGAGLIAAAQKGAGLVSLAPLLGVFGFMASLPVLFGAGHVAWGLKNKTKTAPDLPLPWMYKVMLLSALLSPIQVFVSLSGGIPGLLGGLVVYLAVSAYFRSRSRLEGMTEQPDAAPAKVVVRGDEWRLDLVAGRATGPAEQLKRARIQAVLWGAGIILGAIGLLALHQFSLAAALSLAAARLPSSLWTLIPFGLAGGFLAALFMKVKKAEPGPYADTVAELAAKAGLPMPSVKVGKTTGDPNAFASGALYHLAVVAVVGYITRLMTVREMRGILGHELSHVKYRHMLSFLFAIPFLQLVSLGGTSILQLALGYWAPILWVLAVLGLTRANERMADAGGAKVTGDPRGLATGLRKLAMVGMVSERMPHREGSWLYRLFLSHPDPLERVQTLARMLKSPAEQAGQAESAKP
ncbi:MAG: M48 family metalloprotease [Elusimicrobia bacterium]|nr:M48 family metalloprotease [Elusimicrobiota bacterium]